MMTKQLVQKSHFQRRDCSAVTMDALNHVAAAINSALAYLQSNAWYILFLIGVGYLVKTKGKQRMPSFHFSLTLTRMYNSFLNSLGRLLFGSANE
jgi:hypothetical protein